MTNPTKDELLQRIQEILKDYQGYKDFWVYSPIFDYKGNIKRWRRSPGTYFKPRKDNE